ncbi:hypothetical protein P7C70_g6563, partial [Phenoliferia sp. Uapishka_3]
MIRTPVARAARAVSIKAVASTTAPISRRRTTYADKNKSKPAPVAAPAPVRQKPRRPRPELVLNDSYTLAEQLKNHFEKNQLEEAVAAVRFAPLANVVVWNILIHEFLKRRMYGRAWDTWFDMKKRAIVPSARSYSTFLSGFAAGAKDGHEAATGKGAKDKVNAVYTQWLRFADTNIARKGKAKEGVSVLALEGAEEITNIPTNAYMSYLVNSKNYTTLLETFQAMPSEGPLSPDVTTYAVVLTSLRAGLQDVKASAPSVDSSTPSNFEHFDTAMAIWEQIERENIPINTQVVSIIIQICRDAAKYEDQLRGLDIAERCFGLTVDPKNDFNLDINGLAPPPKFSLDTAAFSGILALALDLKKYNLIISLHEQVRARTLRFQTHHFLDYHHYDIVLVALGQKKDTAAVEEMIHSMLRAKSRKTKPAMSTWTNAMQAYWMDADLARAYRLLELMIGRYLAPQPVTYNDNPLAPSPSASVQYPTPPVLDNPYTPSDFTPRLVCTFIQTALATRNRGKISRALTTVTSLGFGTEYFQSALDRKARDALHTVSANSVLANIRAKKNGKTLEAFWTWRLADKIEEAVEKVLSGIEVDKEHGLVSSEQKKEWAEMAGVAGRWKRSEGNSKGTDLRKVESMEGRRSSIWKRLGEEDLGTPGRRELFTELKGIDRTLAGKERRREPRPVEGERRVTRDGVESTLSGTRADYDSFSKEGRPSSRSVVERRPEPRYPRDDRDYEPDRVGEYDERPRRSDRDELRSSYDRDERPRRDFEERPRSRSFNDGDRPRRTFGSDRPRRDFVADRPRRDFGADRPRRDYGEARPRSRSFSGSSRESPVRGSWRN